jgi:8-oxo-dGTP diphosphatase
MITVAAALFLREGKVLILRRDHVHGNPAMRGLWEFPGGKLEEGETLFRCLEREIAEELHVPCKARRIIAEATYAYDFGQINLVAIEADLLSNDICLTVHDDAKWVPIAELKASDFPSADKAIIEKLQAAVK